MVQLNGNINDCKVIKPRFAVKKGEWAKWEQRYVPGPDFGILVVSTPQGLMTNADARGKKIGGRLVAYIY
jgi:small subunit ribosomal protein S8